MHNIMLDLETLDTASTAVVLSIGAVAFDPQSHLLGEKFYAELTDDIVAQQLRGRTISGNTVKWWIQQGAMAKQVFADPPTAGNVRMPTDEALKSFMLFISAHGGKDAEIWGNGADFDNIILGGLYESFGWPKPWSYSRNRCFRTMKNLALPKEFIKPEREGTHHNALDDAVHQAVYLQEIYRCLKLR